jgi:putative PepSY-like beta-lactamase-inhibitor
VIGSSHFPHPLKEIMMKKHLILALLASLGLMACTTIARAEDEKSEGNEVKVKWDDVPQAVKDTLNKETNNAKIDTVDKETADGKTVYEADAMLDGKNWEVKVAEDGTLVSKKEDKEEGEKKESDEVKVKFDDLPQAVKDSLNTETNSAKIDTVDKESEDGKTIYEADATVDGKKWEIKVGEDGKVISKKQDTDEDKDKDNKKDEDKKESK